VAVPAFGGATFQKERKHPMSPSTGDVLVEHIAPRLRAAVPKVVKPVGAEDSEELIQDAIVIAAQMLESVERAGKTVTPGNIAYYAVLHMKSGRRSQCANRTDAMACGTQLDGKSSVMSMEEEVGYDPELDEAVTLGSLLAADADDPSEAAGRNLDWEAFMAGHDYRYGVIIRDVVQGKYLTDSARNCATRYSQIVTLRNRLHAELWDFMGPTILADVARRPRWTADLDVEREIVACRSDRQRAGLDRQHDLQTA
jgi:hypothetical protein